jgi:hypothetical protein
MVARPWWVFLFGGNFNKRAIVQTATPRVAQLHHKNRSTALPKAQTAEQKLKALLKQTRN